MRNPFDPWAHLPSLDGTPPDDPVAFPELSCAHRRGSLNGLLARGGDLSPARLLTAYRLGIFPWYDEDLPILWWSPDPRTVLWTDALAVPRTLRSTLHRGKFRVTFDTCFAEVMRACAEPRPGQGGTWITRAIFEGYCALHEAGQAHSIESWLGEELVGGLYGVAIGRVFFGESMFARANDASKAAFVLFATQLRRWGFPLVDCQVHTEHLERFGAVEIPRREYVAHLATLCAQPGRPGKWTPDPDLAWKLPSPDP